MSDDFINPYSELLDPVQDDEVADPEDVKLGLAIDPKGRGGSGKMSRRQMAVYSAVLRNRIDRGEYDQDSAEAARQRWISFQQKLDKRGRGE